MTRIRRHAVVTGRVQGVGFRYRAQNQAEALGLAGWVRNRPDGSVEAEFEGPSDAVAAFGEWLEEGPRSARVDAVRMSDREATGETGFIIR